MMGWDDPRATREETRRRYFLRAELDGLTKEAVVYGDARNMEPRIVPLMVRPDATEQEIADADASMSAQPIILNRAVNDPVWARGKITLADATGRVVREMPAKS